jgi:hypothetical protein
MVLTNEPSLRSTELGPLGCCSKSNEMLTSIDIGILGSILQYALYQSGDQLEIIASQERKHQRYQSLETKEP